MKELIGKTILSIKLSDGGTRLDFELKEGHIVYEAWGDCCSESWFEELNGDFLDKKVISVEEKNLEKRKPKATRQEEDLLYGYTLVLEDEWGKRRRADIIYRNSSNGYYGGSCSCITNSTEEGK